MPNMPNLFFHDSGLLNFNKQGKTIQLDLEDVELIEGVAEVDYKKCNVIIIFDEINEFQSDLEKQDGDLMATDFGEVLTLDIKDKLVELIVQWDDFVHRNHFMVCYCFKFEKIDVKITSIYLPPPEKDSDQMQSSDIDKILKNRKIKKL